MRITLDVAEIISMGWRRFCDVKNYNRSPSWKGSNNWYRFMAPAGRKIPEKPPNHSHFKDRPCGTQHLGWLKGHHP